MHEGAALSVSGGLVVAVGEPAPGFAPVRLPGKALLPGLVSAHGHSFQRAIRGRTQVRHAGRSDFWSWREAMYRAAARLDPEDVYAVARMAFHEAARAGIAAVGEFHYLSRDPEGRRYDDPELLARQVIRAAREVGLRIVLLRTGYARGGAGIAAAPEQLRFVDGSPDEVVESAIRLSALSGRDPAVTVGLAPHSVRACPAEWIGTLASEARRRGWPLHVHVAEQPAEVEQCRAEHGLTPVELLGNLGALGPGTTAVHAIHLTSADVEALGRSGTTVCACPTTERDLGDGVVPADGLLRAGAGIALGTDSFVQVDLLEEARALEGNLRLFHRERGLLATAAGRRADRRARRPAVRIRLGGGDARARPSGRDAGAGRAGRLRGPRPRRPVDRRGLRGGPPADRALLRGPHRGDGRRGGGGAGDPRGRPGGRATLDVRGGVGLPADHEEAVGRMRWTSWKRCSGSSPSTRPRR